MCNGPALHPTINSVIVFPVYKFLVYPVYEILFLAGLREVAIALLIETSDNLFEVVDLVVFQIVPERLLPIRSTL